MRPRSLAILLALAALLAGCAVNTQQSTTPATPASGGNERALDVSVPSGATQLRVDTTATPQGGAPDVTVLVKDDAGDILGTHTWALKDRTTDTLTVDLAGQAHVLVIAKVIDGDASLDVSVTALVPHQPEVVVIHQTVVITQQPTATTTATPTPTPSSATPPSPTPTPTPAPTTNATTNNTTTNATAP